MPNFESDRPLKCEQCVSLWVDDELIRPGLEGSVSCFCGFVLLARSASASLFV